MRSFAVAVALSLLLGAAPSFAQGTQAPATPPAAPAAPAASAQPKPFPEGAKFAFINIQRIAGESAEGKASTARVQALNQQKVSQLNELNKKLQADQAKLQQGASVLSDAARAQLERDIEKQQKEVQRFTQDAQEEVQNLQQDLQNAFQAKLLPVIQKVVAERGLQILFSQNDAGIVWAEAGLDITADVIKRFDAANPVSAPPATAAPAGASPAAPAPAPPAKPQD
jgi:Skp family chaperone for outer membrane proteins